ncbi:unnamed protein product [Linum tenue]|uniref:RNase H type-1 domain-containing protein n=1 Tax=Linum tenue TaxID=586396 RepID=A0AAV0PVP2_9ROSI|nr:unnamed protein product [Linum tenue]
MQVISKLNCAQEDQSDIGVICRSIKRSLGRNDGANWRHIPREANGAAHMITRNYTRLDERMVWLDEPPVCLLDQLKLDDVAAEF